MSSNQLEVNNNSAWNQGYASDGATKRRGVIGLKGKVKKRAQARRAARKSAKEQKAANYASDDGGNHISLVPKRLRGLVSGSPVSASHDRSAMFTDVVYDSSDTNASNNNSDSSVHFARNDDENEMQKIMCADNVDKEQRLGHNTLSSEEEEEEDVEHSHAAVDDDDNDDGLVCDRQRNQSSSDEYDDDVQDSVQLERDKNDDDDDDDDEVEPEAKAIRELEKRKHKEHKKALKEQTKELLKGEKEAAKRRERELREEAKERNVPKKQVKEKLREERERSRQKKEAALGALKAHKEQAKRRDRELKTELREEKKIGDKSNRLAKRLTKGKRRLAAAASAAQFGGDAEQFALVPRHGRSGTWTAIDDAQRRFFGNERRYLAAAKFLRELSKRVAKQSELQTSSVSEGLLINQLLREYGEHDSLSGDALGECMRRTADLLAVVESMRGDMGKQLHAWFTVDIERVLRAADQEYRAARKRFKAAAEAHADADKRVNAIGASTTPSLVKLTEAERERDYRETVLRQEAQSTVDVLQCVNGEINVNVLAKLCDYLRDMGDMFRRGHEVFDALADELDGYRAQNLVARADISKARSNVDNVRRELDSLQDIRFVAGSGGQLNEHDDRGRTPLHLAAAAGHLENVRYLIDKANVDVDARDLRQRTALSLAASHGHWDVCRFLLAKGCDPTAFDVERDTPLHLLGRHHLRCARERRQLEHAAGSGEQGGASSSSSSSSPSLTSAMGGGDDDSNSNDGDNPLASEADVEADFAAVLHFILETDAPCDVQNTHGNTPLHEACRSGDVAVVRALLGAGARAKIANKLGESPAHEAARHGSSAALLALVSAGADLRVESASGATCRSLSKEHAQVHALVNVYDELLREQQQQLANDDDDNDNDDDDDDALPPNDDDDDDDDDVRLTSADARRSAMAAAIGRSRAAASGDASGSRHRTSAKPIAVHRLPKAIQLSMSTLVSKRKKEEASRPKRYLKGRKQFIVLVEKRTKKVKKAKKRVKAVACFESNVLTLSLGKRAASRRASVRLAGSPMLAATAAASTTASSSGTTLPATTATSRLVSASHTQLGLGGAMVTALDKVVSVSATAVSSLHAKGPPQRQVQHSELVESMGSEDSTPEIVQIAAMTPPSPPPPPSVPLPASANDSPPPPSLVAAENAVEIDKDAPLPLPLTSSPDLSSPPPIAIASPPRGRARQIAKGADAPSRALSPTSHAARGISPSGSPSSSSSNMAAIAELMQGADAKKDRVMLGSQIVACQKSDTNPKKLKLLARESESPDSRICKTVLYFEGGVADRHRFCEYVEMIRAGIDRPSDVEQVKVFATTFNVGDAAPPDDLRTWIPQRGFDLYCVAAQEAEYSPRPPFEGTEADWFGHLQQHLGPRYIKLAGVSLWTIRIVVLVAREHYYKISNLSIGTEATGIAHVVGNKGGAAIAFDWHDTSLCFVGAHLAAHQHKSDARNSNYREIVRGISGLRAPLGGVRFDLLNAFDHCFFMGDLNYRIDMERDEVLELIEQRKFGALLERDQLMHHRGAGNTLVGFNEGRIRFAPTYKYERGNRRYTAERMRVPSWCDRILWRSAPGTELRQIEYHCSNGITSSDHSPVFSTFAVGAWLTPLPALGKRQCVIVVSNLRAMLTGVDNAAKSASSVVFTGKLLRGAVATPKVRGQFPAFADGDVPELYPFCSDRSVLERSVLRVAIRQHSAATTGSSIVGQGTLGLCGAWESGLAFVVSLTNGGIGVGELHGQLILKRV
jgi:ankyrin repeat protein